MKKNKIISAIATLLTFAMLIGLFPVSAFAAEGKSDSGLKVTESTNENPASEVQSTTQSDVAAIASTGSGITKYFTIDSTNCRMQWKYNGASGTRVNAAFTVYGTPTDATKLTLAGDAVFCVQHFNKTPPNKTQCIYVGKLSEVEFSTKLTEDLTADKSYRIIKAAQAVLKENPKYQNGLTTQQVIFAIQQVFHSSESFLDFFMYGVKGKDFESDSQAKLCGELYKAVYDKFHTKAFYDDLPVPTKQSLNASRNNIVMYRSGDNYILETYTLNMSGVTAKVDSGSTPGVSASVSGSTLTVSIPASKMPTSGNITWNVSLTSPNQSLESVNLYTSGVEGKQELILLEEEYYTATTTVSDVVRIPQENGSVEVIKVDANDANKKLAGAVFIIVDKDRGNAYILPPTDSNGYTTNAQPLPIGRYTITESIAPEGYARSNWSQDFEITADSTTTLSYTVENREAKVSWTPAIIKYEAHYYSTGSESLKPSFTYTFELLDQDGVVIQTTDQWSVGTNVAPDYGNMVGAWYYFQPITFGKEDEGKTFHFTIREKNTGLPQVVYNTGWVDITLKIKDVAATKPAEQYEITWEPHGDSVFNISPNANTAFFNYAPTGSWKPTVKKEFTGGTLTAGQFTFVLEEDGVELQRVKNNADGSIPFASISYYPKDIGRHTYTIREISGTDSNIHYDSHEVTFVVDVSFTPSLDVNNWGRTEAHLTVTQTSVTGSTTFENVLEKRGSWTPSATKLVTGNGATLTGGQFTFVLYENGEELQRVKNNADGTIPFSTIHYTLSDVGTHTYTIKEWIDGQDGWIYDLHTLTYTITVSEGDSALVVTPTASGSTTFTNEYATISIRVEKIWHDNNNANGLRQDIHFVLYGSNGNMIPFTFRVGQTSYTVTDIPKYNLDGEEITYTLSEAEMENYTSEITVVENADGYRYFFTVTNSELTDITVTKVWTDSNNQDGLRANVQLTLIGSDGQSYTGVIPLGETTYTFKYLPVYKEDGETKVEYTLTEAVIGGYDAEIIKGADGYSFIVTNTHNPELTEFTVHKKWVDNSDQDGVRPSQITVTIKGSDGNRYTESFSGSGDDWSYTFTGLPKYWNQGTLIVYTVESEDAVPGYTTSIDGDTITNTHTPATTEVKATKIWDDNDNQDGLRKDVHLTLTGSDGKSYTGVIPLGGTTFTWTDLPVYAGGERIVYTLTEAVMEGYRAKIDKAEDGYTFTVTNTHSTLPTDVTVTKVWVDNDNQYGLRADVHLTLTGSDGSSRIGVIKQGETSYTWTDLPVYKDGKLIVYTLTEAAIDGYTAVIEQDSDGYTFTVTNTLIYGRLHITKTAEDGFVEELRFRVYGKSDLGTDVDLVIVTDADGVARADYILPGTYTVEEIDTPERYEIPAQQTVVVIGDDSDPEITVTGFHNELKRMRITVNKTAEDGVLEGHKFRLTGTDYMGNEIDIIGESDENGTVVFKNLLAGAYTVTEIDTDVRYVIPDDQDVDLTWGKDVDVSFHNALKYWRLTVIKTDESTGEAVAGAVYGIYQNGVLLDEYTTDENGSITTKEYLCGEGYTLREISPAPGFTLDAVEYELDGALPEHCTLALTELGIDVTDGFTRVTITKTDVTTGDPVEGAEIVIYDADGNVVYKAVTDENGQIEAFYLPVGVYTFVETIPADGYTLNPNSFTFEIHEDGSITGDTEFTDEPTHVTITKTDVTTGDPVEGAEIVIYDADGNVVYKAVTDENGQIEAFYLPVGVYTFVETIPADGYTLNPNSFTFEIHEDGSITGDTEFTDEPTHVKITKTDLTTGKPLPGAEITIYDADGNVVYKAVTDENGQIEAFYLPVGVYTFRETYSPDGFKLNENTFTFEIHADGSITGDTEIEDEPYTVTLTKYEKGSEAPVQGAVIEIYGADGSLIGAFTTDENGEIFLRELIPGVYSYKEVSAPDGYVLDGTLHSFTLHADGSVSGEVTFENARFIPKTGDNANLPFYTTLTLLSGSGLAILTARRKKRERKDCKS